MRVDTTVDMLRKGDVVLYRHPSGDLELTVELVSLPYGVGEPERSVVFRGPDGGVYEYTVSAWTRVVKVVPEPTFKLRHRVTRMVRDAAFVLALLAVVSVQGVRL